MILSFLLHAANRNIKDEQKEVMDAFYLIKDSILKKYGKVLGYDIQHIRGKRCNSCGGTGRHAKYSHFGKIYDYADCYHCWGGWYKLPLWICLHRIKFGKFIFHKPLKKHECVGNPFREKNMGFVVTESPVIEGYIEHKNHWFGEYAMLILFALYNWAIFKPLFDRKIYWKKVWWRNWIANKKRWYGWVIEKPKIYIRSYYDPEFNHSEDDLPF